LANQGGLFMATVPRINWIPFPFKAILMILLSGQNDAIDPFKVAKSRNASLFVKYSG